MVGPRVAFRQSANRPRVIRRRPMVYVASPSGNFSGDAPPSPGRPMPTAKPTELTLRSLLLGALITLAFTAANVYLGLKVGLKIGRAHV